MRKWIIGMGAVLSVATASFPAMGQKAPAAGPANLVLDTGSFWRCHLTLRDPLFGKAPDAKPKEMKKGELHWNSTLPPADWMQPEFDDGAWWRSPGPFYGGYGFQQPDTIALISLRGKFGVEDPAKVKSLTFSAVYRGGLVVYLNGKEVKRVHLPEGQIGLETLAENYPIEAYIVPEGAATDAKTSAEKPAEKKTAEKKSAGDKPAKEKTTAELVAEDKPAEDPEAAAKAAPKKEAPAQQKAIKWGWGDPGKYKDRCEMRIRRLENVAIPVDQLRKGMNVLAIEVHRSPYPENYFSVGNWWDGFRCHAGLLSAQLKTDSPEAVTTNTGRPKGFQVWNANPMMAIFDMDYGDPGEQLHPIRIPGCRNGAFLGQVVISSDAAIKGLKAEMSELKLKGGAGGISASAVQIRYAQPGGVENGSATCYGTGEVRRFDPLEETPPAEVPVYAKKGGRQPYGAVQPVWVTVNVPADAAPGDYEGKLTLGVDGQKEVGVPVALKVADWKLPDPTNYVTFVDMVESPEAVAMYYDVPFWSDKHWALIEKTFQQLGRIGNKTVYIPLICKTHFGNSESMVRLVKQADGTYKGDFTVMDKYLDIAQKYLGNPPAVIFYMWDHFAGGGYFGSGTDSNKWSKIPVSLLDPETKKVTEMETPKYCDADAEAFWKPVTEEIREKMKTRGLEKSMMIGICSDVRAAPVVVELWRKLIPEASWVLHTHGLEGKLHGVPVGYCATVWKAEFAKDPEAGYSYGWARNAWNRKGMGFVAHFHRDLVFGWQLTQNRLLPENNIGGGQCGFGRNGADFWPPFKDSKGQKTGWLAGRFPQSNWAQLSLKTCFLAPGLNGAVSTVRFEQTRESVEECEARISIERVLMDKTLRAKLGDEMAKRLQTLLDERIRAGLWGWQNYGWYVSSGWQDRSEKLYAAAAELAKALPK